MKVDDQIATYRGPTRELVLRQYHAHVRQVAPGGYVPVHEEWSQALGEEVLTVRFTHAPDQVAGILASLDTPAAKVSQSRPRSAEAPRPPRSGLNSLFRVLLGIWTIGYIVISCGPMIAGGATYGAAGAGGGLLAGFVAGSVLFAPWIVGVIVLGILILITG